MAESRKFGQLDNENHYIPEYKECLKLIKGIARNISKIRSKFEGHMAKGHASYDIEINGTQFQIRPAFTTDEQFEQLEARNEIFNMLMASAITDYIEGIDDDQNVIDIFKFVLHPLRVERLDLLQDQITKNSKDLHQDTQVFSKDYEDILRQNPKYFLEQAYNFIHNGPDSIDEELLEIGSFRRVLHNYMVSDACTKERDRLFNMKTKNYFQELIDDFQANS